MGAEVEVSFCVVNTEGREVLMACLDAIGRERAAVSFETELLVLDNGSDDGSAEAVRGRRDQPLELVALEERRGKAVNDSELMRRARGRYCLLLNEDSELRPGATAQLRAALLADPHAATAGAALLRADLTPQASAWRFPSVGTALAGALFAHRRYTVQSTGNLPHRVDWAQSAALMVRREAAAAVGYMDPAFFVYSDEVDFQKRLHERGWHALYVPGAVAIHHEQLSTGALPERRIVELSRNRDLYMRKHHSRPAAAAVRWLTAWTYLMRAAAAIVMPGHDPRRYARHASATLHPGRGEGLREAAERRNAGAGLGAAAVQPDA